ncbi:MAG TPA: hypothetical protein VF916_00640 [Ktedonobacterales bacterium]
MKRAGPIQPRRRGQVQTAQEDAETLQTAMQLEAQRQAPTIPVRVQIVFTAEQQPIGMYSNDVQVPMPTSQGEMGQIIVRLDAAELITRLAESLQPTPGRPGGILVPGALQRLPTGRLKVDD